MKRLLLILAMASLATLAACDNNTEPTKANTDSVNQNPKVDKDPAPKSSTGGGQPGTPPTQ